MRGSVFKSGNSWMYQFDVGTDSNGVRIRQSQRFSTKEEAEKEMHLAIEAFIKGRDEMKRQKLILEATAIGSYRSIFLNNHGRLIYLEIRESDNQWLIEECFYVDRNRGLLGEKRRRSVPLKQVTKVINRSEESLLLLLSREVDKLFFGVEDIYNENTLNMSANEYAEYHDLQNEKYYFLIFVGEGDTRQDNLKSTLKTRFKNKLHRSIYIEIEYYEDGKGRIKECYYYDKAYIRNKSKIIPPKLHSVYVDFTRKGLIQFFNSELDGYFTDILVISDGTLDIYTNTTPVCGAL